MTNKSLLNNLTIKSKLQALSFAVSLGSIGVLSAISWYQGRALLKESVFQNLTSIRTAKTNQIEQYFDNLYEGLGLLAEDHHIVIGMEELSRGFRLLEDISVTKKQSQSLEKYYQQDFFPRLAKNFPDEKFDYGFYRPRNLAGQYLQYFYIANNLSPLGEKEKLASGEDGSQYTQAHDKYHPVFQKIIEEFGFSDRY